MSHSPWNTLPHAPRRLPLSVHLACASLALANPAFIPMVHAQQESRDAPRVFNIPSGPLTPALNRFADEAGIFLAGDAQLTEGRTTAGLQGSFTIADGLARLLAGTGVAAVRDASGSYSLRPGATAPVQPSGQAQPDAALPLVEVSAESEGRFGDTPSERGGFKATYQQSATKLPMEIRETPQAITVTTRESMVARQALDLGTALELTAGVTTANGSNGGPFAAYTYDGGDQYSLRGQVLDGNRDVRVDGFALGSANYSFDLAAFERVEVIKGPSSMLYGQGSLGGFINLVRRKPEAARSASIVGQAGSWDTYRTELDATGAIDQNAVLLGRVTAAYDNSGSFIDGVKSDRSLLAPSLELRIGERTRALLEVLYQKDNFIPSSGVPLKLQNGRAEVFDIPRSFFWGVPSQKESSAEIFNTTLRLDHELTDRWLGSLLLQQSNQRHRNIFDNYGFGIDAAGNSTVYSGLWQNETESWAGEFRLQGRFDAFGREHQVLAGLEKNSRKNTDKSGYLNLGTANIYANNFAAAGTFPGQDNAIAADGTNTSNNEAFYGQVVLRVLEHTSLLLGARHDRADQASRDNLADIENSRKVASAWTKRIGLVQDLSENVTAYASYGQSFNPVTAPSRSGDILEPETGKGFEIGLKTEWFGKHLSATIAAFRLDLDNRPIPDPANGPGENFSISAGLQRTDGLELELSGSPIPGLNLGASAAWLHARYIDSRDPNFGLTPVGSVDQQYSMFASYELQGGDWRGLGVGATYVALGDRSISYSAHDYIGGYERVDLNGYYKGLKNWDFSLQLRNLFDKTYIERFRQPGFGNFYGSPRAVLFRTEYRFR